MICSKCHKNDTNFAYKGNGKVWPLCDDCSPMGQAMRYMFSHADRLGIKVSKKEKSEDKND